MELKRRDLLGVAAAALMTQALRARYHLTDVTGHEHIAPGRKTDPGPFFDWRRYRTLVVGATSAVLDRVGLRFPPAADNGQ